ncbi:MAG: DUF4911 domain-containing protein [Aquificaceae bacterium]|nr:DUF4911 domain-containing protein [Aquificaceae bacterium]MDW8237507.1 hypothetical protein [Aquificaceae bacterium]
MKAKVILLEVEKSQIGLLNAFFDGAGRYAIIRTPEGLENMVYVISTPDTFQKAMELIDSFSKFIQIKVLGDADEILLG